LQIFNEDVVIKTIGGVARVMGQKGPNNRQSCLIKNEK